MVELSPLEGQEHGGEGLQAKEVVQDEGGGGVVGAVVERGDLERTNKTIVDFPPSFHLCRFSR